MAVRGLTSLYREEVGKAMVEDNKTKEEET
ncbi:hypothetical protein ES707_20319 [subsurface metagenome]